MGILTRDAILGEIQDGRLIIDPFDAKAVGPASIDLRLGNSFRVFRQARQVVRIDNKNDYRNYSEKLDLEQGETLLLMPGQTVLGLTVERLTLPPDICGWLEGRSRFARVGLLVHISASFMQPGIHNHQVLEMTNFGPNPLDLVPGTAVCQFVFQRTEGEATYHGRFEDQDMDTW